MSTAVIILIAVGAVAILAAIFVATRKRATQRREDERLIALEHQEEAKRNRLDAQKESAIADEEAAMARRQAAEAEHRAHSAQLAKQRADAHAEHAQELDPDAEADEDFDERHEVFDGEREGLYTGERPPAHDAEPAQRQA